MKANFCDASAMPSYSVMTINMNGSGKPSERRALLSKIISEHGPSLVFCQELPGRFEQDVVKKCKGTCDYDFVFTEKEAAVMWSKNDFCGESVDAKIKRRSFDAVFASQNFRYDVTGIIGRTAVVRLTSKGVEACTVLAVSWHGPHSRTRLEQKQEVLKSLILFLYEICRHVTNVSSIIIGGDFNLNTLEENGLEENGLEELNVYFPCYELSPRGKLAKDRKGRGRRYIPYKDNFATTTTSSFEVMNLSGVKPLLEFVYVKEEGSERRKDILDHDPIIGVLQLGQSVSKLQPKPLEVGNNPFCTYPQTAQV